MCWVVESRVGDHGPWSEPTAHPNSPRGHRQKIGKPFKIQCAWKNHYNHIICNALWHHCLQQWRYVDWLPCFFLMHAPLITVSHSSWCFFAVPAPPFRCSTFLCCGSTAENIPIGDSVGVQVKRLQLFFIHAPSLEYLTTLSSWMRDGSSGRNSRDSAQLRRDEFCFYFHSTSFKYYVLPSIILLPSSTQWHQGLLSFLNNVSNPEIQKHPRQWGRCNNGVVRFFCVPNIILIL